MTQPEIISNFKGVSHIAQSEILSQANLAWSKFQYYVNLKRM